MILESTHDNSSEFIVEILTGDRAGTDIVDCSYLGQTIEVMVTAPGIEGNSCWGRVTVEDKFNPDTLRIITRTFTGRDQFWNSSTITQTIYELRPTIAMVQFPNSFTGANALQCNSSNTATEVTGRPYFQIGTDSIPVEASCKFGLNLQETIYDLGCPGKERIERVWTVMDWCNLSSLSIRFY